MPAVGSGRVSPPRLQESVILASPEGPVQLRRQIIDGLVLKPCDGIGIDLAIGIQAEDAGRDPALPYAERAHAELDMRLDHLDTVMNLLEKAVHIVSSPILDLGAGEPVRILRKGCCVFCRNARKRTFGIGIEIVIRMNSIDIITPDNIRHNAGNVITNLRQTRVDDLVVRSGKIQDPI